MGSFDLFLNSKEPFLKHGSLDYMDGDWNFEECDDKILESIRYGDKLMDDDPDFLIDPTKEEPEEEVQKHDDGVEIEEVEPEIDSTTEMFDFEQSEFLSYAVGDEVLSVDSASSSGSCGSADDHNQDFSVVELVGILPQGVKTFQIVQQSSLEDSDVKVLSVPKNVKILNIPNHRKSSSAQQAQQPHTTFQELKLSDEERRLLSKEGITLPSHFPLTKSEERELKRIRRKIRNKISAQDSRKRKKEFLDTLTQRVQEVEDEKSVLNKKVRTLELVNSRLCAQVKKLQSALAQVARNGGVRPGQQHGGAAVNGNNPNVVPAATTLLVLILSLALVVLPTTMQKATKTNRSVESSVLGSFDESNASLSGKSRTMLGISSSTSKTGLTYGMDELDDLDDLDSLPSVAKIPRFSFHQGIQRSVAEMRKEERRAAMELSSGIEGIRKRNSFEMNSIVEQLD